LLRNWADELDVLEKEIIKLFYDLTFALRVGRITDMYEIMSTVNNAAKVVRPS
jgi:hypothetical protein